ncbi:MAG: wax ester/triacylglycerol synthase family O-acyltransferase [Pseudomonadales bacterium]
MKQLGTLDSAFINLENSSTPQHIGGLGIYDPSTSEAGFVRFKDVLASFEQRLNRLPMFRTRLVQVPGDIDRPYWVEDKNFDVEFHIRHISLPKPGDWRQLWIQAARLHSRSLDMSRPLWEAYIIEGLDNIPGLPEGAFAMYTKMHHSLVDGAGGASFMSALHDLEPTPAANPDPAPNAIIFDRQPSKQELLARALINRTTGSLGMLRSIGGTAVELAKYGLAVSRDEVNAPDLAAPKTRFNRKVGPHRVADATTINLDQVKQIKNATGSTINDVALSIIGGALRHYLTLHDELPQESLAASIPLNMRTRRTANDENNQVGSMFAELHTNVEDPIARISAVSASTKEAKVAAEDSPLVEAMRLAGFFSPLVSKTAASIWSKNQLSRFLPMNTSTVITNVPGPNFPMYCAGAEMVRYHGLGLLTPGCGLFHTIFSCNGLVTITILGDRDSIPDPDAYISCLQKSFIETYEAAIGHAPSETVEEANSAKHKNQKASISDSKKPVQKATKLKAAAENKADKKVVRKKPGKKKAVTKLVKEAAKSPVKKASGKKPARSLRSIKIPASAKRTTSSSRKRQAKPTTVH